MAHFKIIGSSERWSILQIFPYHSSSWNIAAFYMLSCIFPTQKTLFYGYCYIKSKTEGRKGWIFLDPLSLERHSFLVWSKCWEGSHACKRHSSDLKGEERRAEIDEDLSLSCLGSWLPSVIFYPWASCKYGWSASSSLWAPCVTWWLHTCSANHVQGNNSSSSSFHRSSTSVFTITSAVISLNKWKEIKSAILPWIFCST